jgi:ABC-type polysaccharide/polyol phosphate transport system ATPase subunit
LGVNGAGKSSLCRCIAGMYKPTTGSVEVFGETRAVFNTNIGIQPDLTGRENAELLTQFLYPGLSKNDAKELINDAINFSELGRFIDAPFRLYSNGMQTRLSLSLVSARPTDLLILDEVFDGADTFFKEKISLRVQKMIQLSGAALFVSHSPDQVLKVCNRAIVLDQAQIVFDGEPSEALNFYKKMRPAS